MAVILLDVVKCFSFLLFLLLLLFLHWIILVRDFRSVLPVLASPRHVHDAQVFVRPRHRHFLVRQLDAVSHRQQEGSVGQKGESKRKRRSARLLPCLTLPPFFHLTLKLDTDLKCDEIRAPTNDGLFIENHL